MGIEIPNDFDVDLSGIPSNVTVNVGELPEEVPVLHAAVDSLPTLTASVESLPVLHLAVDQLPKLQLGLDPIEVRPLEIRLTEIPSVRTHLPADFCLGVSVLGFELMSLRLCGEAQVITEPYRPNPCEVCGPAPTFLAQDEPAEVAAGTKARK